MAGIVRTTAQLFATTGLTPTGGFAAAAAANVATEAGSSNTAANIMTGQPGAWAAGWLGATLGASKFPAIEDMNAVDSVFAQQIAYILARGIPEYDAATSYNIGDICKGVGNGKLYQSLVNANVGNALPTWPYSNANWAPYSPSGRVALTAATTFFVATTGSDSTGTGAAGAPWLTLQHAVNVLQSSYDLAGFTATISVADGIYTGGIVLIGPWTGGNQVQILGNNATPANCIVSTTSGPCINLSEGAGLAIQGLRLQTTTGGDCIDVQYGSFLLINNSVDFHTCAGSHINALTNGEVAMATNYSITGNAQAHINCDHAVVNYSSGLTVTLTGTPAFASDFAVCTHGGLINIGSETFSGSATGSRYNAVLNGVIDTSGGGANYLPGNGAGSIATGGQYA